MQESDKRKGAASADVQVDEQANALIACRVPEEVFTDTHLKVGHNPASARGHKGLTGGQLCTQHTIM